MTSATVLAAVSVRADLQIAGYQDRLHDPFYVGPDKAFIGAAYNWSGYGRIEDPLAAGANWKSVVMISDNYFLTANHNRPLRGDDPAGTQPKVRFYRTTDPNGDFWETTLAIEAGAYKGARVGTTDLWVGKLAETPPSWVTRYPLAKRQEATNYLSYTDNNIFVFGQDSPRSATSVRIGLNEINSVNAYGTYEWDYNPAAGLGADEAQTQSGDSGSPSFFTANGWPVLAGVHTRVNYDTGVAANLTQLMGVVPEPISFSTGLAGDVNGDFQVNFSDLTTLASNYKKSTSSRFNQGDLTGDGIVDFKDFVAVTSNYNVSLRAPADFDRDGDVDGNDLATIGNNWLKSVNAFTAGDANGDSIVNAADVAVFDRNEFRGYFGPLPAPLSPVYGDVTGNGLVDTLDLNVATLNLNKYVVPGTNGDLDENGHVDDLDRSIIITRLGESFGDINGDHLVDAGDFLVLAASWNWTVFGGRYQGDFNGDRVVNGLDANVLYGWWNQQSGYFPGMTIPEPASSTLFAAGLLAAASLRRRRPSK